MHNPFSFSLIFSCFQLNNQLPQTFNTLTPIKSSPMLPGPPFPLLSADESANLSPAKLQRGGVSIPLMTTQAIAVKDEMKVKAEASLGFHSNLASRDIPIHNVGASPSTLELVPAMSETDSSSSGEESDSESSDTEDDTFGHKAPPTYKYDNSEFHPSLRQESKPFQFEYEDVSQDNTNVSDTEPVPSLMTTSSSSIRHPAIESSIKRDSSTVQSQEGVRKSTRKRKSQRTPSVLGKSPRLGSESSTGTVNSCEDPCYGDGLLTNQNEQWASGATLLVKIPLTKVSDFPQKNPKPQVKDNIFIPPKIYIVKCTSQYVRLYYMYHSCYT